MGRTATAASGRRRPLAISSRFQKAILAGAVPSAEESIPQDRQTVRQFDRELAGYRP
jgi:hypothetical protein